MTDHDPNRSSPPRIFRPSTTRDGRAATARDIRPSTVRDALDGSPFTTRDGRPPTTRDTQGSRANNSFRPASSAMRLPDYLERDYDIVEDLDSGGEANVALIRHRGTAAFKVVKIYHRGITLPQAFVDKLASADAAHVLPVTRSTYTGWGGAPRFVEVMDFLPDGSLETLLTESGGRAPKLAHDILVEMTEALDYIHKTLGIVHRDIKPANLLIRRRGPLDLVLADLGIAAEVAELRRSRRETTGGVKGTLVYQSPETLNMSDAGAPRDWWALGMTLCEVLTGQHPFKDGRGNTLHDENAIRHAITMGTIDLSMITDARWNLLCRGLLTHDPAHRWGASQIRQWLAGESPHVATHRINLQRDRPIPAFRFAGQRFTDPAELATHVVTHWDDAIKLFTSKEDCDALRAWIREDVHDTQIETNLLTPIGGNTWRVDARILEFAAHYRGSDVIYRGTRITAQELAIRYLQAGPAWETDPWLQRLHPEVIAALVETQFTPNVGQQGQSAEYHAFVRLSRYADEVDKQIQSAQADIGRTSSTHVEGVDVGVEVREAMPGRVAAARGMARAALLSPACLADVREQFRRIDTRSTRWFYDLCTRAEGRQPRADGVDSTEIALKTLAAGIGDLAQNFKIAGANAEAAGDRRRRDAEAAAAEATRQAMRAECKRYTLYAATGAIVTFVGLIAHIWVTPQIRPGQGWPMSWAYALMNWPTAQTQEILLMLSIAACIIVAILINATDALQTSQNGWTFGSIAFAALCLLPLIITAVCFLLLVALAIVGALIAVVIIGGALAAGLSGG